ncbi:MAG: hypothetical protein ACXWFZ_13925, partial [Nitrososphaeraceae archaeon]
MDNNFNYRTRFNSTTNKFNNLQHIQLPYNFSERAHKNSKRSTRITMTSVNNPIISINNSNDSADNKNNSPIIANSNNQNNNSQSQNNSIQPNIDLVNLFQNMLETNKNSIMQLIDDKIRNLNLQQPTNKISENKNENQQFENESNKINKIITQTNKHVNYTKPTFNGNLKDYPLFKTKFKNYMRLNQIPMEESATRLLDCLTGEAERWYNNILEQMSDEIIFLDTDELFEQILDEKYNNKDLQDSYKSQYETLRWEFNSDKADSVETYAAKLDELAASAKLTLNDGDKKRRFKRNCPFYMRDALELIATQSNISYLHFIELAKRLQANHNSQSSRGNNGKNTRPNKIQSIKETQSNSDSNTKSNNKNMNQGTYNRNDKYKNNPKAYCKICETQGHYTNQCAKYDEVLALYKNNINRTLTNSVANVTNNEGQTQTNSKPPDTLKTQTITSEMNINQVKDNQNTITVQKPIQCHYVIGSLEGYQINNILVDNGAMPNLISYKCFDRINRYQNGKL